MKDWGAKQRYLKYRPDPNECFAGVWGTSQCLLSFPGFTLSLKLLSSWQQSPRDPRQVCPHETLSSSKRHRITLHSSGVWPDTGRTGSNQDTDGTGSLWRPQGRRSSASSSFQKLGRGLSSWRGSSTRVLPPVPSPGAPSDSSPSRPQMGNSGKAGAHAANDAGLGDAAELGKQIRTHRPSMPAAPWRPLGCAGAPSTAAA